MNGNWHVNVNVNVNVNVTENVNVNESSPVRVLALMQAPFPETRLTAPAITAILEIATFALKVRWNPDGLHTPNIVMKKKLTSLLPSTEG
jgi:hypothetical protein